MLMENTSKLNSVNLVIPVHFSTGNSRKTSNKVKYNPFFSTSYFLYLKYKKISLHEDSIALLTDFFLCTLVWLYFCYYFPATKTRLILRNNTTCTTFITNNINHIPYEEQNNYTGTFTTTLKVLVYITNSSFV